MNNRITKEKFEAIKDEYGHYSSWAIWNDVGDTPKSNMCTAIFENDQTINKLHTKYVVVALNISRAIETKFGNFHPDYSEATDYKTRFALKDTPVWGSYMTDVIKDFEEVASGKMMQYLRSNPDFERENIVTFLEELKFIGAESPTLIAVGSDSYSILKRNLGDTFSILKIPHYANYSSKEKYREQVLQILEATGQ